MYDINLSNIKKNKGMYIFFILFGLLFVCIGVAVFVSSIQQAKKMDSEIEAYRVEIVEKYDSEDGYMYSPVHYYIVDGVEYVCRSNSSSGNVTDSMEDKTVYYNSNNPSDCLTDYLKSSSNLIFFIFTLIGSVFAVIGFVYYKKMINRIKTINRLNQTGKLIKNLPYRMEDTNVEVNHVRIRKPVVDYMLPNGVIVNLKGDGRNDGKSRDNDGFVDLLIDPNDHNNYFIDFEINRIGGNLDSDYYKPIDNSSSVVNGNLHSTNNIDSVPIKLD